MSVLSILTSLIFIVLVFVVGNVKTIKEHYDINHQNQADESVEKLPHCDQNIIHDRGVSQRNIFVTTLDGKLSTLDITKGILQWDIETGPGELLSSSIHRLELSNNGKQVRMIPSLSGGIYKFDGESIEAIPVTADDLLKSSLKFADDIVISGGTEVRTYGVNTRTGNIKYEYSMAGKSGQNYSLDEDEQNEDSLLDDTLVLKRHTQTVRAFEPRSGHLRWNFSIGHHELELLSSDTCQGMKNVELEQTILDLELRVIVPEGIVCAYSKKSPKDILWKHKFESPIVSVYRMNVENQRLESLNLFENANWLWEGTNFKSPNDATMVPSVYLGMYHQQLYIQESHQLHSSINHNKQLENNLISEEISLPKIPFKPLPASNKQLVALIEAENDDKTTSTQPSHESTKVMKIDEQLNANSLLYSTPYADGKGFFFYTDKQINESMQCGKKTRSTIFGLDALDLERNKTKNPESLYILVPASNLWDYWKEILVIALTTAFVINFMLNSRRKQEKDSNIVYVTVPYAKEAIEFEEEQRQRKEIEELKKEVEFKSRSLSESHTYDPYQHYVSRFLNDFDLVQCLGKGGFGVVFEVKNKLDDCRYAIKRILLPSKKESRDRVLREVKTLANCEHRNIVRYFHSWIETPPQGWQETKDKELLAKDILSTSITIDSPSPTEESKAFLPPYISQSNEPWKLNFDDKSSFGKSFSKNHFPQTEDSSSFIQFKADTNDGGDEFDDDSIEIEFKNVTQTSMSGMPSDTSHLISFRDDSESLTNHKKSHRRNGSLDQSELSSLKPQRPTSIVPSTTKMYLYIQMQLCMKHSLKDWLMSNDLHRRHDKTFDIWSQIIEAVHYVHLKGLIHRDLKPSNIFFALDGQIKIGDFGLVTDMAEIPFDPMTSSSSNSSTNNAAGFDFTKISEKKHTQRVGTSLYMSPEQGKGLSYNYKVDIFSLGLIFFELLNYFGTESERYRVLEDIRRHKFPSEFIEKHKDEYELLKLMLSKKPEERPTTYGILSKPPLNRSDSEYQNWHFELPTRRRESQSSQNSLSK